jgi:hypothetical protein
MIDIQKKRQILQGMKGYKTNVHSIETIAGVIPQFIADLFRTFFVEDDAGRPNHIGYDWNRLMEFQINLGNMIKAGKFDYLDNVILQFLNGYGCFIYPFKHNVKFSNEEIGKFTDICNKFKDLTWDDIADPFLDATFDLFASSTILNQKIKRE